jgi:hypothetical protein
MRFRTTIELAGKTATGMRVPAEVVAALGRGKRPPVRVTIGGHTYRSTIAVYGDEYFIGVSAENRAVAGVAAGDEVGVEVELDEQPREVSVPADLAEALARDPEASAAFERLSYSHKRQHVLSTEGAKTAETRPQRIAKALELLRQKRTPDAPRE